MLIHELDIFSQSNAQHLLNCGMYEKWPTTEFKIIELTFTYHDIFFNGVVELRFTLQVSKHVLKYKFIAILAKWVKC